MLQLAEVSTPNSQNQESQMTAQLDHNHPVFDFFEQRSVLVLYFNNIYDPLFMVTLTAQFAEHWRDF